MGRERGFLTGLTGDGIYGIILWELVTRKFPYSEFEWQSDVDQEMKARKTESNMKNRKTDSNTEFESGIGFFFKRKGIGGLLSKFWEV